MLFEIGSVWSFSLIQPRVLHRPRTSPGQLGTCVWVLFVYCLRMLQDRARGNSHPHILVKSNDMRVFGHFVPFLSPGSKRVAVMIILV